MIYTSRKEGGRERKRGGERERERERERMNERQRDRENVLHASEYRCVQQRIHYNNLHDVSSSQTNNIVYTSIT